MTFKTNETVFGIINYDNGIKLVTGRYSERYGKEMHVITRPNGVDCFVMGKLLFKSKRAAIGAARKILSNVMCRL